MGGMLCPQLLYEYTLFYYKLYSPPQKNWNEKDKTVHSQKNAIELKKCRKMSQKYCFLLLLAIQRCGSGSAVSVSFSWIRIRPDVFKYPKKDNLQL